MNYIDVPVFIVEPIFTRDGTLCDVRYIDMNRQSEKLLQHSKNAVIGRTILEIFPETESVWFEMMQNSLEDMEPREFEHFFLSLEKHLRLSIFPVLRNYIVLTVHDISKYHTLLALNNQRDEMFEVLFQNSNCMMLLLDSDTGQIIRANEKAVLFYGYPIEKLLDMSVADLNLSPAKSFAKLEWINEADRDRFVFKQRLCSGSIRDVEVHSAKIIFKGRVYVHSVIKDITESTNLLKKIRTLSVVMEQSPVLITITNLDGVIEYVNPELCKVSGYTKIELIGKTPKVFKSGKKSTSEYEHLWRQICSGKKWTGDLFNKKKDGSFYWESALITPVFDNKKRITSFLKIAVDISDKKVIESQLLTERFRAEESDRLKRAFLANLNHEIRTPLNAILGFSQLFAEKNVSDSDQEYLSIINSSGEQLLAIFENTLTMASLETDKMIVKKEAFSLNKFVEEIDQFYNYRAKQKGLEFKVTHQFPKEFLLRSDSSKIRIIIDCLMENALKFTEKGSISWGVKICGKQIHFFVSDTGIGMCLDKQNDIFKHFFQIEDYLTRTFSGLGNGLAISKRIAVLLGGELWAESELENGSQFFFTIPTH